MAAEIESSIKRERWGSRIGVIFAVMGSAIGLGNFLRFPGLAAKYGGGHFMIPYIVAFLLLGLPIAWAEWATGRMGGKRGFSSSPGIFYALWKNPGSPFLGILGLMIPIGIYMYYVYVESWCLYYAISYLTGTMPGHGSSPEAFANFFSNYVGASEHGIVFKDGPGTALMMMLACFALNFVIIYRGLNKGIEFVSKYAIPILFICAIGVLIRVLTLGSPMPDHPEQNVMNGLGFMWNPDLPLTESLQNTEMWLAATGQIFFSLSVGFGIIITYASYVHDDEDVVLSGTTSAAGNVFAEVALGGMITIPAAFIFLGTNFETGTFGLGFVTLPNVFANMQFGHVVGFLWFFLLFIAAVTSSLSMLQPAIAFLEEGLGLGRRASVTILGMITLMGSMLVVFFSAGFQALDLMDFWIGNVFIYIMATIIIIFFGWGVGLQQGMQEAHHGALISIPRIFQFVMKYIAPVYLIVVFVLWFTDNIGGYWDLMQDPEKGEAARYTVGFIVILGIFLSLLVFAAMRRWHRVNPQK